MTLLIIIGIIYWVANTLITYQLGVDLKKDEPKLGRLVQKTCYLFPIWLIVFTIFIVWDIIYCTCESVVDKIYEDS